MGQVKSDSGCVFCRIVQGEIPSERVYEDDRFICIRDLQPQAKTHLLLIPKRHMVSLDDLYASSDPDLKSVGALALETATRVAREQKLLPGGFRLVINSGSDGGQTVFHLHIHLLGGQSLRGHFG